MEALTITPESIFQRNEADFLSTEVDDETVLMHIHDSGYLGLNNVATVIWQQLDQAKSFKAIIEALLERFEVEAAQCEAEVKTVLVRMVRLTMIKMDE